MDEDNQDIEVEEQQIPAGNPTGQPLGETPGPGKEIDGDGENPPDNGD